MAKSLAFSKSRRGLHLTLNMCGDQDPCGSGTIKGVHCFDFGVCDCGLGPTRPSRGTTCKELHSGYNG